MSNRKNKYIFVTDPDDPMVYDTLIQLLEKLGDDFIVETYMDRGLVKYEIITPKNIRNVVEKISYDPITVTINAVNKTGLEYEGLAEIIKALSEKILGFKIGNVETMVRDDNIVTYIPYTNLNEGIWGNSYYLETYYRKLNINSLIGYKLLSDNPMCGYVLSQLVDPNKKYIIKNRGIYLISFGYDDIVDRVQTIISTYEKRGYFFYPIGPHNTEDYLLVPELASLWDTDIIDSSPEGIVLKSTNVDLEFFETNIPQIKRGQFPEITLYGDWQYNLGGDYNDLYGNSMYKYILSYAGILAYWEMGKKDPFISPFTHTVKVNLDLSITIYIPSYLFVKDFVMNLQKILGDQKLFETEYCKDLVDGVIKRYYVLKIDPKSTPLIIPGDDGDVLIFRSPLTVKYNSPFNFSKVDTIDLETDLQTYYSLCHSKMEPVTRDNIGQMNIEELLKLVQVRERGDGPTFCYSADTLLSLERPVNPITRRPFKDVVIIKAMLANWGLRGLFNVGSIPGLYEDFPVKENIEPKQGRLNINLQPQDSITTPVTGPVYDYLIDFGEMESDLFSLASDDPLSQTITQLWKRGFFLNYWTSSLEKYSNIKSYNVTSTNQILIHGSDTKASGDLAVRYLEEMLF